MNEPTAPLPPEPNPFADLTQAAGGEPPQPSIDGGRSEFLLPYEIAGLAVDAAAATADVAAGAAETAGSVLGCLGEGCLGCFSTSVLLLALLLAASVALAAAW